MTRAARQPASGPFLASWFASFFGQFELARAKLAVFRVCFFLFVGMDGLFQIPHAPRYGAGDFNVGHLAWLDKLLPDPSRPVILVIFLLQAYLGFRIAFGAATRAALIALTTLYGYAYFVSQLDSYQHHYLVFLVLLLSCFVPWQATGTGTNTDQRRGVAGDNDGGKPTGTPTGTINSWAIRVLIVQVAIVYFWTTMTKLEGVWLDGTVLDKQLQPGWTRDMAAWLGMGSAATLVMLAELFLVIAVLYRRLWPYAVIVGVSLHAFIQYGAEFKIGIFSYYMFGFYLLLLPDRWYVRAAHQLAPVKRTVKGALDWLSGRPALFWISCVLMLAAGSLLVATLPVAQARTYAGLCLVITLAESIWFLVRGSVARDRAGGASGAARARVTGSALVHMLACAAVLWWPALPDLGPSTHDSIGDYYKYWGGAARRLGQWDEAEVAYREITRLRPDWASGHYHLARIEERNGNLEAALAGYRRAQVANPDDYRGFLNAAVLDDRAQRGPEALAAAQRALLLLRARPQSASVRRDVQRAQTIVQHWSPGGP